MTTGSVTRDYTVLTPATRTVQGNTSIYGYWKQGTFSSRVWSGSDSPARPKTKYDKQFYRIPIVVPAAPDKVVKQVKYVTYFEDVAIKTKAGSVRFKRVKRRRKTVVTVIKRGKPAHVKMVLRYRKVPKPAPPRDSFGENPYTVSFVNWSDSQGVYTERLYPVPDTNSERRVLHSGSLSGPPPASSWDSNDTIRLLGKLREKVAGSDFNFAVFLAEGNESLKMIANAATRIDRSLNALRRGNVQRAWKALSGDRTPKGLSPRKDAASNWLEMQYGWIPLLKDAEAGAQFLAHLSSGKPEQRSRVRSSKNLQAAPGPWTPLGYEAKTTMQITAIYKDVSAIGLSGLLDPLSVVWEKLPYSFVVDWFIPIGNFLSARGLASSLTGTFVTTRVDKLVYSGYSLDGSANALRPTWSGGACTYRSVSLKRTVSSSLDVPVPTVKPLSEALSWKRAANAVALLSQRVR